MILAKRLTETACLPVRQSKEAAGCDLYSDESGVINPGCKAIIRTGIALDVPIGFVAMIYGRSGLTNKYLLEVVNNCIHPGEKDEILLYFYNNGSNSFEYKAGERIAQVVIVEVNNNVVIE
ncbi:hypothetical protein COBT_002450 [Conglomerata obtusa]